MNRGLALPAVLAVLAVVALLGLYGLRLQGSLAKTAMHWRQLDQCALNVANALNHLAHSRPGYGTPGPRERVELRPGEGFSYEALPLGPFWLMAVTAFSGTQSLSEAYVVGRLAEQRPALEIAMPMSTFNLGSDATVEGGILFSELENERIDSDHWLAAGSRIGPISQFRLQGFRQHLTAPFTTEWRLRLDDIFPQTTWLEAATDLDLDQVSRKAALTVVRTEALALHGHLATGNPVLILADGSVTADRSVTLDNCWLLAKGEVRLIAGVRAQQLHIAAPHIELRSEIIVRDASLCAIPSGRDKVAGGTIRLSGRGVYHGILVALDPENAGGPRSGRGTAVIQKTRYLDSVGVVYCRGTVEMKGRHHGFVTAGTWRSRQADRTLAGRLEQVRLEAAGPYPTVWGLPGTRPHIVSVWKESRETR